MYARLYSMYMVDIENIIKSEDPLINNGLSEIS
jgi:hypothetical protein